MVEVVFFLVNTLRIVGLLKHANVVQYAIKVCNFWSVLKLVIKYKLNWVGIHKFECTQRGLMCENGRELVNDGVVLFRTQREMIVLELLYTKTLLKLTV